PLPSRPPAPGALRAVCMRGPGMWNLTLSGPQLPQSSRRLASGTLSIGRAPENDVVFPSDCVSRRHAQLSVAAGGLRLLDLGSRNGTCLNGHPVGNVSRRVEGGDVISLGDYVIKVQAVGQPAVIPDGFVTLASRRMDENPFVTRIGPLG